MLRILLAKDLRRAWRNPLPWLINLIVPLAMTALIGLVFGGKSESGALGRIRFAVVDEDRSILSDFLRGAANQNRAGDHLEPVFMERAAAMDLVNAGKISAVLIIETNFMRNYLTAREPVTLHLIKNPAESIHPAVVEELSGAVVTALNAISRNFNSDFPEWQRVFEGKDDYHKVSLLIEREGDKLKALRQFVNPPLVSYEKGDGQSAMEAAQTARESPTNSAVASAGEKRKSKSGAGISGLFSFLLLGLSAMFLLFLGQNAMVDLHREVRKRTFERYQTMHQQLWPFILGKILFSVVILLICSALMLVGGGMVFQIHWQEPVALSILVLGYSLFAAAFFALLVAIVPDERRGAVLNNVASMMLGLAGGCAFPPQQLPAFVREHITSLMPSYWFVNAARDLQNSQGNMAWAAAALKLAICAAVLAALAAMLFRRRFNRGLRA